MLCLLWVENWVLFPHTNLLCSRLFIETGQVLGKELYKKVPSNIIMITRIIIYDANDRDTLSEEVLEQQFTIHLTREYVALLGMHA